MKAEPIDALDIPELVELGRRAHAESHYARSFPFSEQMAFSIFSEGMKQLAVKCMTGGEIAGFFVGGITTMEFSSKPIGMENSFYVRPESRGTKCGCVLVKAFLDWCEAQGIPAFVAIHYGADNAKTYRFMERMGMKERGRIFTKGL